MQGRLARGIWLAAVIAAGASVACAQELGTIVFPTSGPVAAQPKFLEGVKALHSFQFDEAALAFSEAQAIDGDFALVTINAVARRGCAASGSGRSSFLCANTFNSRGGGSS